ncbi:MAG TPA: hypothetical protein VFE98_07775 [Candidatus Bathyarchaeia archaeon]|nr:hypothetical protein [Candidatus Bathyarchaeia archaeon]
MQHLRFGKASTATTLIVILLFASPLFANGFAVGAHYVSHMRPTSHHMLPLDPSFSPNAPVGGVPFCKSRAYGTFICYPPHWLNTAYCFPAGLDGKGSTIVIVDAFGSPTAQADLNKYTSTFGLPATAITILCGPTWTGASTDHCPAFDPTLPIQDLRNRWRRPQGPTLEDRE